MNALVLWLHIITSIGALVMGVGIPLQLAVERQNPDSDVVALAGRLMQGVRAYTVTLGVSGVLGFGLVSLSDDASWSAPWIWLGIVGWVAANGLLHGGVVPSMRALAGGDEEAETRTRAFAVASAGVTAIVLALMLVQPG